MKSKHLWINAFFAWLVFLGIDFLFHASLLQSLWSEGVVAIKPKEDLARLIPVGYASFYLLCLLINYTFIKAFPDKPEQQQFITFSVSWGLLFSLSNFLGLYSYIDLPLKHLIAFNLVYLVEILAVLIVLKLLVFGIKKRKVKWWCFGLFLILVFTGIVVQNVLAIMNQ